jgi:hypothetical protein
MFNPRYDDVMLTLLQSHGLHQLKAFRRGATAHELADAVYGVGHRMSQRHAAHHVLSVLARQKMASIHYAPRAARGCKTGRKQHESGSVTVYAVTQLGLGWLRHHPEASEPYTPRSWGPHGGVRKITIPHASPQPVHVTINTAKIASLNLKRYAHRPLPLRVRKAAGMPAHFWR